MKLTETMKSMDPETEFKRYKENQVVVDMASTVAAEHTHDEIIELAICAIMDTIRGFNLEQLNKLSDLILAEIERRKRYDLENK